MDELINELGDIVNYINVHADKANLCNECNEDFDPVRLHEISESFRTIKEDIEISNKVGIPRELLKIRDLATKLYNTTDQLHNSIMSGFEVEIKKDNNRMVFILEYI